MKEENHDTHYISPHAIIQLTVEHNSRSSQWNYFRHMWAHKQGKVDTYFCTLFCPMNIGQWLHKTIRAPTKHFSQSFSESY